MSVDSRAVPWTARNVQVVLAATVLTPLGVPLISPALPAIKAAFGLTNARVSLLVTAYFLTGIVVSPVIGMLIDRIGRRTVLALSLALFGIAGGSVATGPPFDVILAIRFLQGTAAAGIFITTVTIIADEYDGGTRRAILGVNTAAIAAGAAIYPTIGGWLTSVDWRAPFVCYLIALPVAVIAWKGLEGALKANPSPSKAHIVAVASKLLKPKPGVFLGVAFLIEFLLFGTLFTLIPLVLDETFAVSAVHIGVILMVAEVGTMLAAAGSGRLARWVPSGGLIAGGFGLAAMGMFGGWIGTNRWTLALASIAFGMAWGFTMPSIDSGLSDLLGPTDRAGSLAIRNSFTFLGRAGGPITFTSLAAVVGYRLVLAVGGVIALITAGVVMVVLETRLHR